MKRLVVVSNRLPNVKPLGNQDEAEIPAGGLASAVFAALRRVPGSIWLGWNGRVSSSARAPYVSRQRVAGVDLLGLPLTAREAAGYYHGFCNAGLWPLFHCFQGRVRMNLEQETIYQEVQTRFAAALRPLLRPGDLVWVHDYHFMLLGRELRRLGWTGRTGFFLHIPFPPHDLWQLLPDPPGVLRALLDYDLVGFQATGSLDNYLYSVRREIGAHVAGERVALRGRTAGVRTDGGRTGGGRAGGSYTDGDERVQRAGVYPVSIDPADYLPPEGTKPERRRSGMLGRVVRGRRLILGVDRLDYTKGISERIMAFEEFIARHPEWRKKVSYIQIASPSRANVAQYAEQKKILEALVGRVNGERAEHDWVPIRYLYRSYPRQLLRRFYREADVGLVTPLRDGMNLVAKEFVAAQHPANPGVLILSRTAGAADELPEALIVNPYIPAEVAAAIAAALAMPLDERIDRWRALFTRVTSHTVHDWGRRFLADLERGADQLRPRVISLARLSQRPASR
jgi:trehalose 6-phosphate synthase